MGEGGYVELTNGTQYEWDRTYQHAYQMDDWNFPTTIPAGSAAHVYVEFDEGIFLSESDDAGEVTYQLKGTPYAFQIQARGSGGFHLQVVLQNFQTLNNPQGSTLNIGWKHNGVVNWCLSGTTDLLASTNPPSNWMHANLSVIGNHTLRHLCIPGSHDAGMCAPLNGGTAFGTVSNCVTQSLTIGGQLGKGARYFDIRPVISGGIFKCGHYSQLNSTLGWQGANGEVLSNVINDINNFTANNKELIILNFSHGYNTDLGNTKYRDLNQDELNRLMQQLLGLQNLFIAPNPTTVDLADVTLNQFIGQGQAAVVVIMQTNNFSLGDFATKGFYTYGAFNLYNSYSNTDDVNKLSSDQLSKLKNVRTSPNSQMFLLSWTLTQQVEDIINPAGASILDLAAKANTSLWNSVFGACTQSTYPNVIFIDDFSAGDVTALAMAINQYFAKA